MDAELTVAGPSGTIRGGPRGHGAIPVLDLTHVLTTPFDLATGRPSGSRRHAPLGVVKEVDRSSPVLLAAWSREHVLTPWRLEVFATDQVGRRRVHYVVELRRARITGITTSSAEGAGLPRETVAFAYEGIDWTWVDGTVTASDVWAAPG